MGNVAPLRALIGGALIGLSVSIVLLANGRVAGISGIYGRLFQRGTPDRRFGISFLAGFLAPGILAGFLYPAAIGQPSVNLGLVACAGLLVGFGTMLAGGCTSGHGVCGVSRMSPRSLVATGTFTTAAVVTLWLLRVFGAFGAGR